MIMHPPPASLNTFPSRNGRRLVEATSQPAFNPDLVLELSDPALHAADGLDSAARLIGPPSSNGCHPVTGLPHLRPSLSVAAPRRISATGSGAGGTGTLSRWDSVPTQAAPAKAVVHVFPEHAAPVPLMPVHVPPAVAVSPVAAAAGAGGNSRLALLPPPQQVLTLSPIPSLHGSDIAEDDGASSNSSQDVRGFDDVLRRTSCTGGRDSAGPVRHSWSGARDQLATAVGGGTAARTPYFGGGGAAASGRGRAGAMLSPSSNGGNSAAPWTPKGVATINEMVAQRVRAGAPPPLDVNTGATLHSPTGVPNQHRRSCAGAGLEEEVSGEYEAPDYYGNSFGGGGGGTSLHPSAHLQSRVGALLTPMRPAGLTRENLERLAEEHAAAAAVAAARPTLQRFTSLQGMPKPFENGASFRPSGGAEPAGRQVLHRRATQDSVQISGHMNTAVRVSVDGLSDGDAPDACGPPPPPALVSPGVSGGRRQLRPSTSQLSGQSLGGGRDRLSPSGAPLTAQLLQHHQVVAAAPNAAAVGGGGANRFAGHGAGVQPSPPTAAVQKAVPPGAPVPGLGRLFSEENRPGALPNLSSRANAFALGQHAKATAARRGGASRQHHHVHRAEYHQRHETSSAASSATDDSGPQTYM